MEAALLGQAAKNLLRRLSAVDHAEHLLVIAQPFCQRVILQNTDLPEGHTAKAVIYLLRLGAQLRHSMLRRVCAQQIAQGRLRGGTQYQRGADMLRQRCHCRHTGPQVAQGQHLRFVENDNAVCKAVELAAFGGTVGVQGIEKPRRRCHHHRHIPVFRCQRPTYLLGRRAVGEVKLHAGVVLQHIAAAQNAPKHLRVLLDDGGVGNDIDHPLHAVGCGVTQSKCQ